jgi:ABC-type sugar transport system substrate-binding protein
MKYSFSSIRGAARTRPRTTRILSLGLATVLAVGLAACSTGGGTTSSSSGSSSDAKGIATANSRLNAFRTPQAWQGPDAKVDVSKLSGKTVTYISVSQAIPVLAYWATTVKGILAKYNVTANLVDAGGTVAGANKGFAEAIADKSSVIVLLAMPPALFKTQIAQAHAAGIKVITAQTGVPNVTTAGQDAEVTFDYPEVGKLIGDWFVENSKGKGKGLIVTSDDVPASEGQANATIAEAKELCPACVLSKKDVQIPQWQTSIPTLFQSTYASDPTTTYLLPLYDGQALPGLSAIRSSGLGSKLNVGTFNATPGIVQDLLDPKTGLKLDIGGDNQWYAYALSDGIFRQLAGVAPVKDYHVGLRVFDQSNAKAEIVGTDQLKWYGPTTYITKFTALWGK